MNFKIYVIFHKTLFKDFYEGIPEEVLRKQITFFGVNEEIPKSYDPWFQPSVIHEYQLQVYNPLLQKNKFYESSVYHHLAHNNIIEPYDYVGCLHYDMKITNNTLNHIQETIDSHQNKNCLFYLAFGECDRNILCSFEADMGIPIWRGIIDHYNIFYKTTFVIEDIFYDNIPMFHSFIMPKALLHNLIPFIDHISREIHGIFIEYHTLPYHLERLWGISLLLKKKEGLIPNWFQLTDIHHDESRKDKKYL
jgi:hypothetical protein